MASPKLLWDFLLLLRRQTLNSTVMLQMLQRHCTMYC